MLKEETVALAYYRLEKARSCLRASELLLADAACYADSANRSYYAIFHAINAVFALEEVGFKKHSGVIGYFKQH